VGGVTGDITVRVAEPADYDRIAPVVDEWWGGRAVLDMLPRLFFLHFRETTLVAEEDGELAGFLAGFLSQTHPDEAYVHFAGVGPAWRGQGVGRMLYERFFAVARERSRTLVRCVTSPGNRRSVAFHRSLGFEIDRIAPGYDGRGGDRVLLVKRLGDAPEGV
jgi:ribosomal protein S18 acetylase RimI-like enzyme